MKIGENEIFLSPRVALGDRIDKLQRSRMKNQEERDDIKERTQEAWKAPMVIFSLFSREEEDENEWFKMS